MRAETVRLLNLIQLVSEGLVALGFLIGLIPFLYGIVSASWVVPLVIVNVVLAFLTGNGTLMFTAANVVLALLSFIPLVGFLTRLAGAFVSLVSIAMIRRRL